VKPESNSDSSEQVNQKLTALENPGIAVRFENFWQRFGNGNKKGEKCPAAIY
jgi:hypothetical protein